MLLHIILIATALFRTGIQAPVLTSLSPTTVVAGDTAFWLTVGGSGFVPGSVVRVDNVERTTTLLSPTKLAAMITAKDIARVGTRQISVVTPAGDRSASLELTVVAPPPPPRLLSISPSVVIAGEPAFRLTVNGSHFTASSMIEIDGVERATFDATPNSLIVDVPAEDLKSPGTRRIRVVTPPPGGGASSFLELQIKKPN